LKNALIWLKETIRKLSERKCLLTRGMLTIILRWESSGSLCKLRQVSRIRQKFKRLWHRNEILFLMQSSHLNCRSMILRILTQGINRLLRLDKCLSKTLKGNYLLRSSLIQRISSSYLQNLSIMTLRTYRQILSS